jgi:PAS domain S-box-containing protein
VVRQLALIVGLFVLIVACLVALFNVQIGVLWAVRAYVGGEGLWSKGQKDAVHHLTHYASTHDEADYRAFRSAITVPLGDHVARVELEKPTPDYHVVRRAFVLARNHPDDADGMAHLFRRFRNVREMDQAIRIWAAGDHSIEKLVRYGEAMHEAIAGPHPNERTVRSLLEKIDRVNARVTPLEDAFSRTLGVGARRVRTLSMVMTLVAAAVLLLFGIGASWMILSDARRSEHALQDSEARYRGLFEDANDAVYVQDLEGRLLDVNKATERMTGYTREEFRGLGLDDLVVPEQREMGYGMLAQTAREGGASGLEITIVGKDGRQIPIEVSTRVILEHDRPVAVQGIARDVTERRRVEEERVALLERERTARTAAEQANRTKDEFLAMLSHELRTPLTAILTWAHLLRGGRLDDATRERAVDVIERNTRLQTAVIGDLLDISRIVAGKVRLDAAAIDAAGVVAAALDAIREELDAKEIVLTLRLDPTTPPVLADGDRLQQIVNNLLSNAIKFSPPGGAVEIGLAPDDAYVSFWVRDAGAGISPEFLPIIFEPFRQADSSDTRPHGGLGLGLAIVRHLVELHGGTITAESDGVDKGATFRIRLPVAAAEDVAPVTRAPLPPTLRPALLGGMDVLIVDDDHDTRSALGAALEERGAHVRLAASAAAALAAVDEQVPDVLLCDLDMPADSGLDLIRTLRNRDPAHGGEVPAAAITAHVRDEDARVAREAGFQRHLAKPVDPFDLTCTVAELAALAQLERAG